MTSQSQTRNTRTAEKSKPPVVSGGRRFALYAELGKYFTSDGQLDEAAFRKAMRKVLSEQKEEDIGEGGVRKSDVERLNSYLEEVLEYLDGRGMSGASVQLLQAAVDESQILGVDKIEISVPLLQRLLSTLPREQKQEAHKRRSVQEKRKLIFEAALQVFSENGFHETTIDDIASLAGLAKGTIYRVFASKEALLDELLEEKNREIVENLSDIFDKQDNILVLVQKAIEAHIEFIEKNHVFYRLIQDEAIVRRSGERVMFYDYLISNLPMLKERIVSMNQEGTLKTTSFYTVWYGILGFIDGVVHKWVRSGMSYSLRDEVPVVLEVLFNGFVGEARSGKKFFIPPENMNGE